MLCLAWQTHALPTQRPALWWRQAGEQVSCWHHSVAGAAGGAQRARSGGSSRMKGGLGLETVAVTSPDRGNSFCKSLEREVSEFLESVSGPSALGGGVRKSEFLIFTDHT